MRTEVGSMGVMLFLSLWVALSGAAEAVPIAVYGALPNIENVALSPDGARIAYVRTDGDARTVFVANVSDQKLVRYARFGREKLRYIEWADDDNVLITTSVTNALSGFRLEEFFVSVYNIPKNEVRSLPGQVPGSAEHFSDVVLGEVMIRHIEGHTVVFVPTMETQEGLQLIRCDLTSGLNRITRSGSGYTTWLVDAGGQLVGEQSYDPQTQRWSIGVFRNGNWHEGESGHAALDPPEMSGLGPTADTLLVHVLEDGSWRWKLLSVSEGKFSGALDEQNFYRPLLHPFTGRLIGRVDFDDVWRYRFFDAAVERHWKEIVSAFDGAKVTFVSMSSDFSKFVVLVEGGKVGYRYELIDVGKPSVTTIGKVYASIDHPLEVRRITYPAADGLQIPAYLTLPSGREARKLPLIVLPHGGPAAFDTSLFDWWSQALADQGYAVLRPNYRGSTVDERLLEAGYGQWGRKMQTDLSDGVRYLGTEGIVDTSRVCIVGASYGGYAALAGAALDPSVYRCAVSVAGLSDLARMLKWEGSGGLDSRFVTRYWSRFWNVAGASDPRLNEISPLKHVDAIKAPILLIHGSDDTTVPIEQSQLMLDALQTAKKTVELVKLKAEDHWLSRSETRLQMLDATVRFLRAHNPPD